MKKIELILLSGTLCILASCTNYDADINRINQRLDSIEYVQIKSLAQQIDAINESLPKLEETDRELKACIKSLQSTVEESGLYGLQETIRSLTAKDAALESKINSLKQYVNSEIVSKDWAKGTFATLEQYSLLQSELSQIKNDISQLDVDLSKRLYSAISDSEASMKAWVNEELSLYSTIADTDSKLQTLSRTLEDKVETQKNVVRSLFEELNGEINLEVKSVKGFIEVLSSGQNDIAELSSLIQEAISFSEKAMEGIEQIRKNSGAIISGSLEHDEDEALAGKNNELMDVVISNVKQFRNMMDDIEEKSSVVTDSPELKKLLSTLNSLSDGLDTLSADIQRQARYASIIVNAMQAIAGNADAISDLQKDMTDTRAELTESYTKLVRTAINELDGKLSDEIGDINKRFTSKVTRINSAISELTARVTEIENEIENIKTEISDMKSQLAEILRQIQSVTYVPEYADGNATMIFSNHNGTITPGAATLNFQIYPETAAAELYKIWDKALSVRAVYTITRAESFIELAIENVELKESVLSVLVSGSGLSDDYFIGNKTASVCLHISDGTTSLASSFVNMLPTTSDYISISDEVFKSYLLNNYDVDGDGLISVFEADNVVGIDVSDMNPAVSSLSGINAFVNLETLKCSGNEITSIDLSANKNVKTVIAGNNRLRTIVLPASVTNLDVSGNKLTQIYQDTRQGLPSLETCNVSNNSLMSLNLSTSSALKTLDCSCNELKALNAEAWGNLESLDCSGNKLTELNLKHNAKLAELYCDDNLLKQLDMSRNAEIVDLDCSVNALDALVLDANKKLKRLTCSHNMLTGLNLFSCTDIETLDCSFNNVGWIDLTPLKNLCSYNCSHNVLTSVEVSRFSNLSYLNCSSNMLSVLNVSMNEVLKKLDCSCNPDLKKVWVRDKAQESVMTLVKDESTEVCYNAGAILFPDTNLKNCLLSMYDEDRNGEISMYEADNITDINCKGKDIKSLVGLENCTQLLNIDCSGNSISEMDFHANPLLRTIVCYGNPVSRLNIDNCSQLHTLMLMSSVNAISNGTLSVSGYNRATSFELSARNTKLTGLAFTDCQEVTSFCFSGDFTNLNFSGNPASYKSLNPSEYPNLISLNLNNCALTDVDVTRYRLLESLSCSKNSLTRINLSNSPYLEHLDVSANRLSVLNVRNNPELKVLNISQNSDISAMDIDENRKLAYINVSKTGLRELKLTNVAALANLDVSECPSLNTIVCPSYDWLESVSFDNMLLVSHIDCVSAVGESLYTFTGYVKIDKLIWSGIDLSRDLSIKRSTYYSDEALTACPVGWRLPTYSEFTALGGNCSEKTSLNDMDGRWFSGSKKYSESVSSVFIMYDSYWSSVDNGLRSINMGDFSLPVSSYAIRCVKN